MSRALVIGGTGPTGRHIVDGLLARDYEVTILHRGHHEDPTMSPDVEHIHVDPFDADDLAAGLAGREFDVAVAGYGRLRLTSAALVGRTGHVVALGGVPAYKGYFDPHVNTPYGYPVPVRESFPVATEPEHGERSCRVARAEEALFSHSSAGAFTACVFRYAYIYGPGQLVPREWCVIKRILDGRRVVPLPDGGLALLTHGYARNMAHAVLLAVEDPAVVNGAAYNCGDEDQLSLRQCVEVIAATMGVDVEVVSTPDLIGHPMTSFCSNQRAHHRLMDISRVQRDLGYRDLVPANEAMSTTTQYYIENPPTEGPQGNLQDTFDYAMEDRLLDLVRRSSAEMQAISGDPVPRLHAYR